MSVFICGFTAWTNAGSMRGLHANQPQRTAVRMGTGEYAMGLGDDQVRRSPVEKLALNVKGLSEEERNKIYDVADTLFNVVDRNGDEFISKEELASHLLLARYSEDSVEALFDLIDIDMDGSVSRAELRDAFVKHPSLRGSPAMGVLSKSKRAAVHEEADETFTRLDVRQRTAHTKIRCAATAAAWQLNPSSADCSLLRHIFLLCCDSMVCYAARWQRSPVTR